MSRTTIKRMVETGVLAKDQIVPWAPWEIKREDLDSDSVQAIVKNLKSTGRLDLEGDDSSLQQSLFVTE